MSPTPSYVVAPDYCPTSEEPVSRTYQYRKVMKPMLERKRRARINRCLDELKELMVTALQSEGENVSKLEKADILELTVRHLHGLKQLHQEDVAAAGQHRQRPAGYADRFRAGFAQCAREVSHFLEDNGRHDGAEASDRLMQHLGACVRGLEGSESRGHQESVWRPW